MPNRILVIDDEPQITRVLRAALTAQSFDVRTANEPEEGLQVFKDWSPDLVITDLMMPGLSGVEVCRAIRTQSAIPVLVLSVRDHERSKVEALDAGADDYVTKPFSIQELLARVRAMGRRGLAPLVDQLRVGDLVLDRNQKQLLRGELEIPLTRKEFVLLELLMRRPQQVISRNELIEVGWGYDADVSDNSVDFYIHSLRSKIHVEGKPSMIRTVRAQGYALSAAS